VTGIGAVKSDRMHEAAAATWDRLRREVSEILCVRLAQSHPPLGD
jgi:hypothetical protein